MSYTEKNFQTTFGKRNRHQGVFELKITKGKSIRFDSVKEHQIEALVKAQGKGLFHKISDFPMFTGSKARFNFKKPFDCFFVRQYPAYVVVMFYELRKKKKVYYITINNWLHKQETSSKKSITEKELKGVASYEESYMK